MRPFAIDSCPLPNVRIQVLSHVAALLRDSQRLQDQMARVNVMPLGSGALAGHAFGTLCVGLFVCFHMRSNVIVEGKLAHTQASILRVDTTHPSDNRHPIHPLPLFPGIDRPFLAQELGFGALSLNRCD